MYIYVCIYIYNTYMWVLSVEMASPHLNFVSAPIILENLLPSLIFSFYILFLQSETGNSLPINVPYIFLPEDHEGNEEE